MNNRIFFMVALLLMLSSIVWAQQLNKVQREAFILGTLNDYMGRRGDAGFANTVDNYDPGEDVMVHIIDSLLVKDYKASEYKTKRDTNAAHKLISFQIISGPIAERLNRCYLFKPSGASSYPGNETIFYGVLIDSMLVTDEQKMAFLAGVYVRFSKWNHGTFKISIANSGSKIKLCEKLLKAFNSSPSLKVYTGNVPTGMELSFHPTGPFKKFLDTYIPMAKRVSRYNEKVMTKLYNDYKRKRCK